MGRGGCACGLPVPDAAGCICLGQRGGGAGLSRGAFSAVQMDGPPAHEAG